jgi:hypothetical protein
MNRLMKIVLLMGLAVVIFGAYRYVSAQDSRAALGGGSAPSAPTFHVDIPETLSTKHALQGTYINSGSLNGVSVSAGLFTPIDPQLTVLCPGTGGTCTISADMWIQNGATSDTSNLNRVCLYVDGAPAPFCDYYAGETLSDLGLENSTNSDSVTVTHGNHTVQMYFWSQYGTAIGHYHSNYNVYKP